VPPILLSEWSQAEHRTEYSYLPPLISDLAPPSRLNVDILWRYATSTLPTANCCISLSHYILSQLDSAKWSILKIFQISVWAWGRSSVQISEAGMFKNLNLFCMGKEVLFCWYFVIRLYTTRVKCIITLLSLHVSALLGHHQVTNIYNLLILIRSINMQIFLSLLTLHVSASCSHLQVVFSSIQSSPRKLLLL
jgi:hypothetical protein